MLQDITYVLPNQEVLFQNIHISLNRHEKVALIGHNGVGKSTLLKIMSGVLKPTSGRVQSEEKVYSVSQILDQFNGKTVAEALGVSAKLHALKQILEGDVSELNFSILSDDWNLEERCQEALNYWGLESVNLLQSMDNLSGGQKTKVLLAGIQVHEPSLLLMDEPTNHLDSDGRNLLLDFISKSNATVVVISHDRALLNEMERILELTRNGIHVYGGNYAFYKEQKALENNALEQDVKSMEKTLRKAKEKERETLERQQKLDARGKKKQENAGVARIMMNTMRNNAEKSTSKLKDIHEDKIAGISDELRDLRTKIPDVNKMKFGFDDSGLHKGKVLFLAEKLNWKYDDKWLWEKPLDIRIESGERIAIKGTNGSGKSTLMNIILGRLEQSDVYRADNKTVYVDQNYSLLGDNKTVLEEVQSFNTSAVAEHEVKMNLHRLLFPKEDWNKPYSALSGGERMRLVLCCLTINRQSPDMIILDEPTNNLDIQNIEILTRAIKEYRGTLLVVSHDTVFLDEIGIERDISLRS
jgi:ATPase subunit of ABC transporter with duplicated ATPase domains